MELIKSKVEIIFDEIKSMVIIRKKNLISINNISVALSKLQIYEYYLSSAQLREREQKTLEKKKQELRS